MSQLFFAKPIQMLNIFILFLLPFLFFYACSDVKTSQAVEEYDLNPLNKFKIEQSIKIDLSSLAFIDLSTKNLDQFYLQIEKGNQLKKVISIPLNQQDIIENLKKIKLFLDPGEYKLSFFFNDSVLYPLFEPCPKSIDPSQLPSKIYAQKNLILNQINIKEKLISSQYIADEILMRPELLYCGIGSLNTGIQGKIKITSNEQTHRFILVMEDTMSSSKTYYPLNRFKKIDGNIYFKILQILPGNYRFYLFNDLDLNQNYSPCIDSNQLPNQISVSGFDNSSLIEIKDTPYNNVLENMINASEISVDHIKCVENTDQYYIDFSLNTSNQSDKMKNLINQNQIILGMQLISNRDDQKDIFLEIFKPKKLTQFFKEKYYFNLYYPPNQPKSNFNLSRFWLDLDGNKEYDQCSFLENAQITGVDCWQAIWNLPSNQNIGTETENINIELTAPLDIQNYFIWSANLTTDSALIDDKHPNRQIFVKHISSTGQTQISLLSSTQKLSENNQIQFMKKIKKDLILDPIKNIYIFSDEDQNSDFNPCDNQAQLLGDSIFLNTFFPSELDLSLPIESQDFNYFLIRQELCKQQASKIILTLTFPTEITTIEPQNQNLFIQITDTLNQYTQEYSCLTELDQSNINAPQLLCPILDDIPIGKYNLRIKPFERKIKQRLIQASQISDMQISDMQISDMQISDMQIDQTVDTINDMGLDQSLDQAMIQDQMLQPIEDQAIPMTQFESYCFEGTRNEKILNKISSIVEISLDSIDISLCQN